MKQLPLTDSLSSLFRVEGDKLLATVRDVIGHEVKQADDFARTLGVSPSQLSSALNGNGHNFSVRWLPAALHVDSRRKILAHQASLVGCRVMENELTDVEYRQRMESALRRAGPAGEAIRKDALEEP